MIFAVEDHCTDMDEKETIEIKKDINDLLNIRANLWNKLFSEETKLEEVSQELEKIVAKPLLTYDIEAFEQIKNEYTSMEKILNVDVLKVENIKLDEKKLSVDIEVEWLMEGFERNYKEKLKYRMNLIKSDDKWKISDYKVI